MDTESRPGGARSAKHVQDTSNGTSGGVTRSSQSSQEGIAGGDVADVLSRYRSLLAQKKELKRKLKQFDEDFTMKHGRTPKKNDKEVCNAHDWN